MIKMGAEKMNKEWKTEEIEIKKIGDKAYAFNISYYNDNFAFLISPGGMNRLYSAINDEIKSDIQESLI